MTALIDEIRTGVIIARFQVPELHAGHRHLIEEVMQLHKRVVVVLGTPRTLATDRYALSFRDRAKMITETYPTVEVISQRDCRTVERWAKELDGNLLAHVGEHAVLYGSRDSFIPKYLSGRYETSIIDPVDAPSGTEIREALTSESFCREMREAFRAGQIRAVLDRPPVVYPVADVILFSEDGKHVWLGRKAGESGWRFFGGFIETTDNSALSAIKRELEEEAGIAAVEWKVIGTQMVDDWRYRNTRDRIMTVLHSAKILTGEPKAGDDIEEVCKVPLYDVRHWLVPEHRPLWDMCMGRA